MSDEQRTLTSPPATQALTVAQAAAKIGVSVSKVRRLIRRGLLSAWRVGSSLRVREDDVDALAVPVEVAEEPARGRQRRKARALSPAEKLADRVWGKG